jgi:hypothetical protein
MPITKAFLKDEIKKYNEVKSFFQRQSPIVALCEMLVKNLGGIYADCAEESRARIRFSGVFNASHASQSRRFDRDFIGRSDVRHICKSKLGGGFLSAAQETILLRMAFDHNLSGQIEASLALKQYTNPEVSFFYAVRKKLLGGEENLLKPLTAMCKSMSRHGSLRPKNVSSIRENLVLIMTDGEIENADVIANALGVQDRKFFQGLNYQLVQEFSEIERDGIIKGGKEALIIAKALAQARDGSLFDSHDFDVHENAFLQYYAGYGRSHLHDSAFSQVNRDAIIGGGKHAADVVQVFGFARDACLFPIDDHEFSQLNRDLLMQGNGENIWVVAKELFIYYSLELKESFKFTQGPSAFNVLLQELLFSIWEALGPQMFGDVFLLSNSMSLVDYDHFTLVLSVLVRLGVLSKKKPESVQKIFAMAEQENVPVAVMAGMLVRLPWAHLSSGDHFKENIMQLLAKIEASSDVADDNSFSFLFGLLKKLNSLKQFNNSSVQLLVGRAIDAVTNEVIQEEIAAFKNICCALNVDEDEIEGVINGGHDLKQVLNEVITLHGYLSLSVDEVSDLACILVNKYIAGQSSAIGLMNQFVSELANCVSPGERETIQEELASALVHSLKSDSDIRSSLGGLMSSLVMSEIEDEPGKVSLLAEISGKINDLRGELTLSLDPSNSNQFFSSFDSATFNDRAMVRASCNDRSASC